jgi:hypothetical protein
MHTERRGGGERERERERLYHIKHYVNISYCHYFPIRGREMLFVPRQPDWSSPGFLGDDVVSVEVVCFI